MQRDNLVLQLETGPVYNFWSSLIHTAFQDNLTVVELYRQVYTSYREHGGAIEMLDWFKAQVDLITNITHYRVFIDCYMELFKDSAEHENFLRLVLARFWSDYAMRWGLLHLDEFPDYRENLAPEIANQLIRDKIELKTLYDYIIESKTFKLVYYRLLALRAQVLKEANIFQTAYPIRVYLDKLFNKQRPAPQSFRIYFRTWRSYNKTTESNVFFLSAAKRFFLVAPEARFLNTKAVRC